ncbi:MAG TPA: pantetheine-phosphate adenylyltransferase [Candidatus Dormibacteraeota bacterium]
MTTAVYPGSFDPIHSGHLDVIGRACEIFDRVVIGVLDNEHKRYLFSTEERAELVRRSLPSGAPVEVRQFSGLAVAFASQEGAQVIIRGLRAVSDLDSEFQMALMNRRLEPKVHTVFLTTGFSNVYLSSSLLKDVCAHGGSIEGLVAPAVELALRAKLAPTGPAPARAG